MFTMNLFPQKTHEVIARRPLQGINHHDYHSDPNEDFGLPGQLSCQYMLLGRADSDQHALRVLPRALHVLVSLGSLTSDVPPHQ